MMISVARTLENIFQDGFRRIKVLVRGRSDVQISYEAMPFGEDSLPPLGWRAIHGQTTEKGKTVIIGYANMAQLEGLMEGEKRLYSTDSDGKLSTSIFMRTDGTLEIGGDTDFMVRYSALEEAFNSLQGTVDDLITAYNAHVHTTTATIGASGTPGIIAPTTSTGSPSTADISPAKVEEVKTI